MLNITVTTTTNKFLLGKLHLLVLSVAKLAQGGLSAVLGHWPGPPEPSSDPESRVKRQNWLSPTTLSSGVRSVRGQRVTKGP